MGSSPTRDRTRVPCVDRWLLNHRTTGGPPQWIILNGRRGVSCALPNIYNVPDLYPPDIGSAPPTPLPARLWQPQVSPDIATSPLGTSLQFPQPWAGRTALSVSQIGRHGRGMKSSPAWHLVSLSLPVARRCSGLRCLQKVEGILCSWHLEGTPVVRRAGWGPPSHSQGPSASDLLTVFATWPFPMKRSRQLQRIRLGFWTRRCSSATSLNLSGPAPPLLVHEGGELASRSLVESF